MNKNRPVSAPKPVKNPVPMGKRDIIRFTVPVVIDNFATTSIGLLYSALVGKISSSALAAVGLANSTINVLISACAVLTTGSAILMRAMSAPATARKPPEPLNSRFSLPH